MLFGKGLFQGTQEPIELFAGKPHGLHLSVIGEELGFLGCIFLLFLYFILIYRGIMIAKECKDPFGMMLATGVVSMWAFQILVNVGMTAALCRSRGFRCPS